MKPPKITPLYHQIYLTLRNELLAGRYAGADGGQPPPLPSEVELAELYGASRVTVRRALSILEKQDGLIVRKHGVGTFQSPQMTNIRFRSGVDRLYDDLSALTNDYDAEVLSLQMVATPAFILGQIPDFGARSLHMSVLSRHDGRPVHWFNQYVPETLAAHLDLERAGQVPLLLLLQRQGVVSETTDIVVSATAADIHSSLRLDVASGTPLITTKRISTSAEGEVLEYFESHTRPDQYRYKFRFSTPRPA